MHDYLQYRALRNAQLHELRGCIFLSRHPYFPKQDKRTVPLTASDCSPQPINHTIKQAKIQLNLDLRIAYDSE
jgi:hypothetical protein